MYGTTDMVSRPRGPSLPAQTPSQAALLREREDYRKVIDHQKWHPPDPEKIGALGEGLICRLTSPRARSAE